MNKNHESVYRTIIVFLSVILVLTLLQSPRSTQAAPQAAGAQKLGVTVFYVSNSSLAPVTSTYAKLANLGTFTVHSDDSLLELTYNGRIYAVIPDISTATGVIFELRVDDTTSSFGRARAHIRKVEGGSGGIPISFSGMFSGFSKGDHTASVWVRTPSGTATEAMVNPGGWESNVLIVKEHLPFGVSFLPMITK